jgi:hypothetical protein
MDNTKLDDNFADDSTGVINSFLYQSIQDLPTFQLESIVTFMASTLSLLQPGLTYDKLDEFSETCGSLIDNQNWFTEPQNLKHWYSLLQLCSARISEGWSILIIEGCDSRKRRLFPDVDIIMRKDSDYLAVDVKTYSPNPYERLLILNKLKVSYPFCEPAVTEVINSLNFKLDLVSNIQPHSDFDKDFKDVDKLLEKYDSLKFSDLKSALTNYCSEINLVNLPNIFRVPKICDFTAMDDTLIEELVTTNSPKVGKWFDQIMQTSVFKTPSIQENYGHDLYSNIIKCSFKSFIKIPVIHKSTPLPLDFQKSSEILRVRLINLGIQVPYLLRLFCMLTDDTTHPNSSVEKNALESCYDYKTYKFCSATRVRGTNGDLINRVRIMNLDPKNPSFLEQSGARWECSNLESVENIFNKLSQKLCSNRINDHGSVNLLKTFLSSTMIDSGRVGELARDIMSNSLINIEDNMYLSMLASHQEFAQSLTASWMKQVVGTKSKSYMFNVDNFTDRLAIILSNDTGPASKFSTKSCMILGDIDQDSVMEFVSSSVKAGRTNWFTVSSSNLEWFTTILYKSLSHMTSLFEHNLTLKPRIDSTTCLDINKRKLSFLSLVMMLNSNKFAQFSEQTRYLFVNATGISIGCKELYEKMMWYKPSTFPECLYGLRLMKMTNVLQGLNSSSLLTKALKLVEVRPNVHNISNITTREWNVCFPHESVSTVSDQNCFNSFYICKAFSINRYQKTLSESQVILKQLESRKSYLSKHIDGAPFSQYNPDAEFVMWSVVNSMNKIFNQDESNDDKPIVDVIDYNLSDVAYSSLITDVMNNRGSVAYNSDTGLVKSTYKTKQMMVKKRQIAVRQHINQNSKCWETTLIHMSKLWNRKVPDIFKSKERPVCSDHQELNHVSQLSRSDLNEILLKPVSLSPYIVNTLSNQFQFVAKMVHKDQIGVREIAVLNQPARHCCYYLEQLARRVQSTEHLKGDFVNLIENKQKDAIVDRTIKTGRENRRNHNRVIYDNADCSKWGPSMMPHILYLTLAMRTRDHNLRLIIRDIFCLFSKKVFKIPDNFYEYMTSDMTSPDVKTSVSRAKQALYESDGSLCDVGNQIIYTPEGMFQGILGCTSSVFASDSMRMSESLIHKITQGSYHVNSHVTSDDSIRVISTADEEERLITSLNLSHYTHCYVLDKFGIVRSNSKSTYSEHTAEFNSIFRTTSGTYQPEIKSRLSFIDVPFSSDPHTMALECMNKGLEYLRKEGSTIGACWITILNYSLCAIANQTQGLYSDLGTAIYRMPLELFGLPKINPALMLSLHPLVRIQDNYSLYDNNDGLSLMMSYMLDPDGNDTTYFKTNNGGIVNVMRRPTRNSRKLQEYMKLMTDEETVPLLYKGRVSSLMRSLVACLKREETSKDPNLPNWARYLVIWSGKDKESYHLSDGVYRTQIGKELVSRRELFDYVKQLSPGSLANFSEAMVKWISSVDITSSRNEMRAYEKMIQSVIPLKIFSVPHIYKKDTLRTSLYTSSSYNSLVHEITNKMMPKYIGGESDFSVLAYYLRKLSMEHKLKDLSQSRSIIKLSLYEYEENYYWPLKLISSNFCEGAKLVFDTDQNYIYRPQVAMADYHRVLENISKWDYSNIISNAKLPGVHTITFYQKFVLQSHLDFNVDISELLIDRVDYKLSSLGTLQAINNYIRLLYEKTGRMSLTKLQTVADSLTPLRIQVSKSILPPSGSKFVVFGATKSVFETIQDDEMGYVTETIIQATETKWTHYVTIWRGSRSYCPRNTKTDEYKVLNLTETMEHLPCRLKMTQNIIFLVIMNNHPVVPLCEIGLLDMMPVYLVCAPSQNPLDRSDLKRLKRVDNLDLFASSLAKMSTEFKDPGNEERVEIEKEMSEAGKSVVDEIDNENMPNENFDFTDDAYDEFFDMIEDQPEERTRDEDEDGPESDDEDFEQMDDPGELAEGPNEDDFENLFKMGSSTSEASYLKYSLVANSMSLYTMKTMRVNKMDHYMKIIPNLNHFSGLITNRSDRLDVYVLQLPFDLGSKVFEYDLDGTPVSKLLDWIDTLEEVDAVWARSILSVSLDSAKRRVASELR